MVTINHSKNPAAASSSGNHTDARLAEGFDPHMAVVWASSILIGVQ